MPVVVMRSNGINGLLSRRPSLRCQKPVTILQMPERGFRGAARAVQGDPAAAVGLPDVDSAAGSKNGCVDMCLNPRVEAVKASRTVEITGLAQALREQGKDVISLAAGEPDFATPDAIVAAGVEAMRQGITKYTQNAGTSQLRKAVCQKLQVDNDLEYTPDCIVLSNGAKQSVWQGLLATCGAGDEVLIPAPYWVSYPEMAVLSGATPTILETSLDNGFLLTPEQLSQALTPASRLLILCSPSNPTGAVYPRDQLEGLAEVIRGHPRLLVLADEIYEHIVYDPSRHHSFASLPGMWERTLTVNGFSKAYSMTGWRLGYLAAPPHFAAAANKIQSQTTSAPSSISQHAGLAALALGAHGGEPVKGMVEAFRQRRDFVVAALAAVPGVRIHAPDGAFYVFPDVSSLVGPDVTADGFGAIPDGDALCRYLVEHAQVAAVPGSAFGQPNCIRLSYAASLDVLKEGLSRIARALDGSVLKCNKQT